MKFCPQCASELVDTLVEDKIRKACPDTACGFIHFNNPTPVVAMLVETDDGVIMAHNVSWPKRFYSIITGFLEEGEDPKECAERETKEELGLTAIDTQFIGLYAFPQQNQIIMAYYIKAVGTVTLNHELDDFKFVARENLRGWNMGTGLAITDWLKSVGIDAEPMYFG